MSKQDINAQMAAALASEAGESTEAVQERVEAAEDSKQSKLAAMLAQAAEAQAEKKVQAKPATTRTKSASTTPASSASVDEDGNSRQRRNYDVPTRQIHVFKSEAMKAVFISSNLLYDNKESAKQVELCRRDLKPQKKPTELMAQEDLVCETVAVDVPFGDELNQMKADLHDQMKSDGWKMISNRPRVNVTAPKPEPVAEETPAVVDVPMSDVADEELTGMPEVEAEAVAEA